MRLGLRVWGFGFGVCGFGVGSGFRVLGLGFAVLGLVKGFGFRVLGLGFLWLRVLVRGFGFGVKGFLGLGVLSLGLRFFFLGGGGALKT